MPLALILDPDCIRHEMSTYHPKYREFLSRIIFFLNRGDVLNTLALSVATYIKVLIGVD